MGEEESEEEKRMGKEREGQGKGRDENGRGEGRETKGWGSCVKSMKTAKNRDFYQIFIFGCFCIHPHPLYGPHLARKCRPVVYSSISHFVVIGIYYFI